MANTTEHSVRIKGDNKQLKQVMAETQRIFKRNAFSAQAFGKAMKDSFKGIRSEIDDVNSSLGKMVQKLTSGPGGGIMRLLGGVGIAGAGLLASGASAAMYARAQTAGQGLQLNAFGAGNRFRSNTRMGYSPGDTLGQRLALTQGMGGTGQGLAEIQALSRATGVDASAIIGSAGTRREIGGGRNIAAVRRTMGILSQTLGETFDKGRLGSFMSSIDQTLSSMGSGVNVDEKSFVSAFASLLKDPTFKASPARGAQALGAIDSTFKNASGNNFGMIMQLMSDAMPGGTPLERMFEARRGVFAQGKLGGRDRQSAMFGSIGNMFGEMGIGGNKEQDRILRAMMLQNNFGVQGADTAASLGDAIAKGDIGKAIGISKEFATPENLQKKAIDIMSSTDGNIVTVKSLLGNILDKVGDQLVPAVIGIAKRFGVETGMFDKEKIVRIESELGRDRQEAFGFLGNMSRSNKFHSGSLGEFGSLQRAMPSLSENERAYAKQTLEQEIQQGRNRLGATTDPQQREVLEKLLNRMELFVAQLERLENKNTNVTVQNSRGRNQDIGSKEFGKMK